MLLAATTICLLIASCGSGGTGLPEGAKKALDNYIVKWEGGDFEYSISSAERAPTLEVDEDLKGQGYDQAWCVLVDQMVTYTRGSCSAKWNVFLVLRRQGVWEAGAGDLVGWSTLEDLGSLRQLTGCQNVTKAIVEIDECD